MPTQSRFSVRDHAESKTSRMDATLSMLRDRFTAFRKANPSGTRIPVVLRDDVLAALDEGVSRARVRSATDVSWGQMRRWQSMREDGAVGQRRRAKPTEARVFSVINEDLSKATAEPVERNGDLELRLGGWSVKISALKGAE